jgi:hypothetical protein
MLCTVRDKASVLGEIRRVLAPGASLGLLVVLARGPQVLPVPDGNHFPTERDLVTLLAGAGFELLEQVDQPSRPPLSWSRRAEQVAAVVATRHQAHPAHALAAHQGERFTHLFASGQITVRLIHAVSRTSTRATYGAAGGVRNADREAA